MVDRLPVRTAEANPRVEYVQRQRTAANPMPAGERGGGVRFPGGDIR
jgi:hypothetical protein